MTEPMGGQLRQALDALAKMRVRLEAAERGTTEPIAIVGIGCRLPGGIHDPASFWTLLTSGVDAVTEVPADRWDSGSLYDPDPLAPGKVSTRWGAFLDGIHSFDAAFFDISPREAARMDPQQRLLLEVAWDALEDASQDPSRLAGSAAGVFVGVHSHSNDYWTLQAERPGSLDAYAGTGTSHSVLAGRLSYQLDLRGPSLAVDTACSSSLVALHLAAQALRTRECDLALAAGVNVILAPEFTVAASRMQMLAADGRCKTFDDRADGFVRGEGCGVVVLKRLSDAVAAGDPIRAIVRGSAVNQDGRTNGLTAPNGRAQEALIRRALELAGVAPEELGYVEAHGTGTPLGDPIEMEALGAVMGSGRPASCLVGSVKTNLGHLEGAAGIAGVIKTVLALQHGAVPAHLHFRHLNPHILLPATLAIPTVLTPWPAGHARRCAGVSSFGWSGTNAHVVLEAAPSVPAPAPAAARDAVLLPLSARSPAALAALARSYAETMADPGRLEDLVYTAAVRRAHHEHRLAVVGPSAEAMRESLSGYLAHGTHPAVTSGHDRKTRAPIVFVFPGQGSQWPGMGRRLLAQEPVFRESLERCDDEIRREAGWSVIERLTTASRDLDGIDTVQPTLFAVTIGLAALWQSWGIRPGAVVGHSLGEVAAAHVAGALDLADAVRVICRRSRLLRRLSGRGAMAAVDLSLEEAQAALAGLEDRLAVAVSNGPRSTVISGDPTALETVLGRLRALNVFGRLVKVDVASHSPQVDEIALELRQALDGITPRATGVPMYSTVTGRPIDGANLGAEYWVRNVRQPVLFGAVMEQVLRAGFSTVLEVSPHPILLPAIETTAQHIGRPAALLHSLRRDHDEMTDLLTSLGQLYCLGAPVRWPALQVPGARPAPAPSYPWQRRRFWLEDEADGAARERPRRGTYASIPDWLWRLAWRPEALAMDDAPRTGRWLVLAERGPISRALRDELEKRGNRVVTVYAGAGYGVSPEGDFTIDPQRRDDFRRLLDEEASDELWTGVAHLWALDAAASPDRDASPAPAATRACVGVLHLVQALSGSRRPPGGRLWIITQNAQAIGPSRPLALAQAPLWGLGPVVGIEHPALWGGLVDADMQADPDAIRALADELTGGAVGERVGFRDGRRHVARLEQPAAADGGDTLRLRPDRAYLVTGGLGGVGRRLARWLVERGARHLVLVGRHAARTTAVDLVAELEAAGVRVVVERADVTDANQVAGLLERIPGALAPLGGIFHAAAILDDGIIDRQDASRVDGVLGPKVAGAWNLHAMTQALELDCFVMFGSATAILGTPAQAAYASGNAFLDALAHHRRAAGLPALVIDWGRWDEVGLAAVDAERARNMAALGFEAMAPAAALDALGRAMVGSVPQLAIMAFDPDAYRRSLPGRELPVLIRRRGTDGGGPPARPALAETLRSAPAAARGELLLDHVRGQVAAVLRLDDPEELDVARGFFTLGMDSLMAVELKNRLQTALGLPLPSTVVFDRPSIAQLAGFLARELGSAPSAVAPAGASVTMRAATADADEIRRLPRHVIEALLADELKQLKGSEEAR